MNLKLECSQYQWKLKLEFSADFSILNWQQFSNVQSVPDKIIRIKIAHCNGIFATLSKQKERKQVNETLWKAFDNHWALSTIILFVCLFVVS